MSELKFKRDMTLELSVLTTALLGRVKAYYRDPEHRREFEVWYKQKYGKDYEWKNRHDE